MSTFVNKNIGLKPRLSTWDGTVISKNNRVYVRLTPGTVNNILPSNWQSELEVRDTSYICLKVFATSSSNRMVVTGATLIVKTQPPIAQEPKLGAPPAEIEILLGIYYDKGFRSIFTRPIFIYPSVFYTVPKSNPSAFAFPYDKYFIWEIVS